MRLCDVASSSLYLLSLFHSLSLSFFLFLPAPSILGVVDSEKGVVSGRGGLWGKWEGFYSSQSQLQLQLQVTHRSDQEYSFSEQRSTP
jgi:hypothetical protein